jgi:hypothetical protein
MGVIFFIVFISSMAVCDFDIVSVSVAPGEADTPLPVDPDTVLSLSISFERFEVVVRRNPQVIQMDSGVQRPQLAHGDPLKVSRQATGTLAMKDSLRFFALERPDHSDLLPRRGIIVKRYYRTAKEFKIPS